MHLPHSRSIEDIVVIVLLLIIALASIKANKLTIAGGTTGFLVAMTVYWGGGLTGVIELSVFFALGVLASRYKRDIKFAGTMQDTAEARTAGQVLANAGAAALMAVLALWQSHHHTLFEMMLAGSLASATADTLASELGIVFSKRFYNCITFKPDMKGKDGVISVEGLLFGTAGAFAIALIQTWHSPLHEYKSLAIITLAGTMGNYMDSVLGATLERKNYLSNNWVNFLNTLFASLCTGLMLYIA